MFIVAELSDVIFGIDCYHHASASFKVISNLFFTNY
jgi:hypothetical protein